MGYFKKIIVIALTLALVTMASACGNSGGASASSSSASTASTSSQASSATPTEVNKEETAPVSKGKIVILATGGTIAGVGDAGKEDGYKPGTLKVEDLLSAVPGLKDIAEIEAVQVCNVNSDDVTIERK